MTHPSRRDFLRMTASTLLAVSGLLGAGGLARFLGYAGVPSPVKVVDAGPAALFPPGSRTFIPAAPAILLHTATGFVALDLHCTHLGCVLKPDGAGYVCPCHGSTFSEDGQVRRGPAAKNLAVLAVERDANDHLLIYLA